MGTRRSRHNRGRKPLYKEHRLTYSELVERNHAPFESPAALTAEQILSRPAYIDGMLLNRNLNWREADLHKLAILAEANAPLDKAEIALGRPMTALAWRVRDTGLSLPPAWSRLITKYRARLLTEPLLQFPYIKKSRPEHADLLRANALVPRGYSEDVRADICQSVMLSLFEGTVTLDELEKNKSSMRYFIGKFYKDQRLHQEVTGIESGNGDDDRAYYDRDPDAAMEWRENEANEIRGNWNAHNEHMKPTLPTQIEEIYAKEMLITAAAGHFHGTHLAASEVRRLVEAGEYAGEIGTFAKHAGRSDAVGRAHERLGMKLSQPDLERIKDHCARSIPLQADDYTERHRFKFRGQRMEALFDPVARRVVTIMPV